MKIQPPADWPIAKPKQSTSSCPLWQRSLCLPAPVRAPFRQHAHMWQPVAAPPLSASTAAAHRRSRPDAHAAVEWRQQCRHDAALHRVGCRSRKGLPEAASFGHARRSCRSACRIKETPGTITRPETRLQPSVRPPSSPCRPTPPARFVIPLTRANQAHPAVHAELARSRYVFFRSAKLASDVSQVVLISAASSSAASCCSRSGPVTLAISKRCRR